MFFAGNEWQRGILTIRLSFCQMEPASAQFAGKKTAQMVKMIANLLGSHPKCQFAGYWKIEL